MDIPCLFLIPIVVTVRLQPRAHQSIVNKITVDNMERMANDDDSSWFCTLIGITPPNTKYWEFLSKNLTSIIEEKRTFEEKRTLHWTTFHSFAKDVDRDGQLALIGTVHSQAPLTPQSIVDQCQSILEQFEKEEKKECEGIDAERVLCELWASAPAPLPLRPLNSIKEYSKNAYDFLVLPHDDERSSPMSKSNIQRGKALMHQWGIFVQPNLLPLHQIQELIPLAEKAIDTVEAALAQNHPHLSIGTDNFLFQEIASRSQQRFDLRIALDSVLGQTLMEELWGHPTVQGQLQALFPNAILDDLSVEFDLIYSKPGASHQGWHADGHHLPHHRDSWGETTQTLSNTNLGLPHALCLFVPLLNLTPQVGFTQFWPKSHQYKNLVGFGPVATLVEATYNGLVHAGDAVWYDYRLLHRGMPNDTEEGMLRCIIQMIATKKAYTKPVNFGTRSVFDN